MITTINEFRKYFESLDINKEYKLNKQTNKIWPKRKLYRT